jgi:hypothetical protein
LNADIELDIREGAFLMIEMVGEVWNELDDPAKGNQVIYEGSSEK